MVEMVLFSRCCRVEENLASSTAFGFNSLEQFVVADFIDASLVQIPFPPFGFVSAMVESFGSDAVEQDGRKQGPVRFGEFQRNLLDFCQAHIVQNID